MTEKQIASAVLGFLTPTIIALICCGMMYVTNFIGSFALPPPYFWAGFFLFIGAVIVGLCILTFVLS
jgi:hypothetical protein